MMKNVIVARGLKKIYHRGSEDVYAVDGIDLEAGEGELVAITGPSGSGKTTLLNILGCLDNPSSGTLSVGDERIFGMEKELSEQALTRIRRRNFGYIFQKFYLIPTLTVLENVMLPAAFYRNCEVCKTPAELLKLLGLEKRAGHLPSELSGGEMQRVAIARALINSPRILLADEPTGSLDSKRADEIKQILRGLASSGITVLMVTHNEELADAADRRLEIRDGRIF